MEARLDAVGLEVKTGRSDELIGKWRSTHDDIRKTWQALAERYVEKPTPSPPPTNLSHLEHLQIEYQRSARDVEAIIGWSQPTAARREQLRQQNETVSRSTIELKEAVFWMDNTHGLTGYKVFRAKWLHLDLRLLTEPLEVIGAMSDVIFVNFYPVDSDEQYAQLAELICNLPSVTSICVPDPRRLPAIQRDTPLFINDYHGSRYREIEAFLRDSQSQLAHTRRTHVFIHTGDYDPSIAPSRLRLSSGSKIAVSFFGPPSGNLSLILTHSSGDTAETLILKGSQGSRTLEYTVPFSLTTTLFTLSPMSSDPPSFVPSIRNNLIIEGISQGYIVRDIRLHDEAGNDYNPASPEA
jgi:hypothetical protein